MTSCSVENCGRESGPRGYCGKHYQRWRSHGDPLIVLKPYGRRTDKPACSVDGCDGIVIGRGWCGRHYQRWAKYGDPLELKQDPGRTAQERFWSKVDKNGPVPDDCPDLGPCWVWTAGKSDGYGMFWMDGRLVEAHIVSYTWANGPIPDGLERDHLCRNRSCVNPDHLESVTGAVNNYRGDSPWGINHRKTHCPQGHPYDAANTYINNGRRICRACARARSREWYRRTHPSPE